MPASDPSTPPRPFRRPLLSILRAAALVAIASAGLAVILLAKGNSDVRVSVLIATALGLGFSVLLGTALVTLPILGNRMGQDQVAADRQEKDNHETRS